MQENPLKNMSQQVKHHKNDPDQLSSIVSKDQKSYAQDGLYYKNFAGSLIFTLITVCVFLAVIYEP